MLCLVTSLRQVRFGELMALYEDADEDRQYFLDVFFRTSGTVLALWEMNGVYVSALRLEPYRDGMLIAGLVTARKHRQKGYARHLVLEVQKRWGLLYSHVDKKNVPSLRVHKRCGFRIIKDCAAYLDGSVDFRCYTMLYDEKNPAS